MWQKFKNLYSLLSLGLAVGATTTEKFRLTLFLLEARVLSLPPKTAHFTLRMHGIPVRVRLRNNFADAYILNETFTGDEYSLTLATDPEVIFDLGANVGFVALSFAIRYPNAKIFCFEPDPENFAELRANTSAFPQIMCLSYAVGAKNETRLFYKSPVFHMRNSFISRDCKDTEIEVEVISLEEALLRAGVEKVDIMKFDVEGAEAEIFSSFTRFNAIHTIVGEIHPYLWSGNELSDLLATLKEHYRITVRTQSGKEYLSGTLL